MSGTPSVAVVGGGITGLVAAYRLRRLLGAHARIVLLEGADRLGGKLHTVPLAGDPVDVERKRSSVAAPRSRRCSRSWA